MIVSFVVQTHETYIGIPAFPIFSWEQSANRGEGGGGLFTWGGGGNCLLGVRVVVGKGKGKGKGKRKEGGGLLEWCVTIAFTRKSLIRILTILLISNKISDISD